MFSTLIALIVITSQMPPTPSPDTYLCVECNTPLFKGADQCEPLRGWLTFSHPLDQKNICQSKQKTLSCSHCGQLLGHLSNNEPLKNINYYYINPSTLKIKQ